MEKAQDSKISGEKGSVDATTITTKTKKIIDPKVKSDQRKFSYGVFNLMFSTWLITAYPHCYWIWHSVKLTFLLLGRYFNFKKLKWQYFLLDFCYTVNYWSILYYFIAYLKSHEFSGVHILRDIFNPLGPLIFRVFFTWCVGPLALSIPAFKNSLVFHSSDQIGILAVHLSPNLAVYGIRWFAQDAENFFPNVFHIGCHASASTFTHITSIKSLFMEGALWGEGTDCHASFTDLYLYPILLYVILWTIPYTLFFFIFGRKMLEDGGYHTVYSTMKDSFPFNNILSLVSDKWKPFVYMAVHGATCSLSFLLGPLLWHSYFLHTAYLIAVMYVAVCNGGSYYFQVFANRYAKSIEDINKIK